MGRKTSERIFQIILGFFMILACVAFLIPVVNVISLSLSGSGAILRREVGLIPVEFTTIGYQQVFSSNRLMTGFKNSFLVILGNLPLSLVLTSMAAYPLAFGDFKGKKVYNAMIMFTMWFAAGLIPNFMVVRSLGMLNSLWSLIIPSALGAYNILILRNFMSSISMSLIESAKIDGATDFTILFRVVLPLSLPVMATLSLWIIVARWNEFFNPLMYITNRTKFTLQVVLRDLLMSAELEELQLTAGEGTITLPEQLRNASIVVSMVPMLIIYPFLQKYFVSGIMLGGVKE